MSEIKEKYDEAERLAARSEACDRLYHETLENGSRGFCSSGSLGALSAALAKAQGEIEGAKKEHDNPFFHARYAALSSVWDACRGPLSKNGLAVVQLPGKNGEGLFVDSILSHASGEWISSRLYIKPLKDDPQSIGSAITYARRYGLQALVGIAPMDDDAEAAMARQHSREAAASKAKDTPLKVSGRKPKKSEPETAPAPEPADEIPMYNGPKHSALAERLKRDGISEEDFMAAARFTGVFPATAKAFRLMSEATAAQFIDDPDLVGVIMKNWKSQKIVTP